MSGSGTCMSAPNAMCNVVGAAVVDPLPPAGGAVLLDEPPHAAEREARGEHDDERRAAGVQG